LRIEQLQWRIPIFTKYQILQNVFGLHGFHSYIYDSNVLVDGFIVFVFDPFVNLLFSVHFFVLFDGLLEFQTVFCYLLTPYQIVWFLMAFDVIIFYFFVNVVDLFEFF